jgi:hypothetical protein
MKLDSPSEGRSWDRPRGTSTHCRAQVALTSPAACTLRKMSSVEPKTTATFLFSLGSEAWNAFVQVLNNKRKHYEPPLLCE